MIRKTMTVAILVVAAALASVGPVLAGQFETEPTLPAPGVLGLVAMGVIGAIALARSRKLRGDTKEIGK